MVDNGLESANKVFDAFPLGVYVYRLEQCDGADILRLVYGNRVAEQFLGVSLAQTGGREMDEIFPGLRALGIPEKLIQVIRTGQSATLDDFEYADHRVALNWYSVKCFPLYEDCVGVLFEQITDSKQAMERLEKEVEVRKLTEKRLSNIARAWTSTFDTMPDCVALIGPDHRFQRVNRSLSSLLGCEPADIIGRPCYEVMHGTDEPWPDCPHNMALETNSSVSLEVDDPNIGIPLMVTCTPYTDWDGQVAGTVHVARDISGEKKAVREREKLITQLQQAVANVKTLSGFLPICASCKKIRDDEGYWQQIETYIREHSQAQFSHGICPDCAKSLYPDLVEE